MDRVQPPDPERLRRLLGARELEWLVRRSRRRLEQGERLTGPVTLARASDAQRQAAARLVGRRIGTGASLTVDLATVEGVLRSAGLAPDLTSAIEALTGPVTNRAATRAEEEAAWAATLEPLWESVSRRPELAPWLEWVRATGLLRRLAPNDPGRARELAVQALAVLTRLPARAQPLSVLAATSVHDGHALDPGRPLSTVVLRAVALIGQVPWGEGAEWRRTVWAAAGVLCGELTNPVLALGLPGDPTTATGRALEIWREAGQSVHLSARQLLRDPPELALAGRDVFVCENPSVVAEAAHHLGSGCAPLVCTSSHPGAAATILLRHLAASGARLRYHGDFDWPGVEVANGVITRFGAVAWRMDTASYRRAAAAGGRNLAGQPVVATWEPSLTSAMAELAVRVEEEQVLGELLADLS